MRSAIRTGAWLAVAALLLAAPAPATEVDDDLDVVRRAVSSRGPNEAPAPAATQPARASRRSARSDGPEWLKVRLRSERDDGASLSLNVPLALIRAVDAACDDDDDDDDVGVYDLLEALGDAGPLVSIEGDDAHIRVWVE